MKPINQVKFVEATEEMDTLASLVALAVSKGASTESIQIFLDTLKDKGASIIDEWDIILL